MLGVLQGITELFPISSLGHTVLFPTLFGWHRLVAAQSQPESFWLAFVVMLHVGSAIGLLIYFWRDWIEIITAFFRTLAKRRIETSAERLAWLIIAASIPVGILGILLEHPVRVALAKPTAAAIFLVVNGFILIGAERLRRRPEVQWRSLEGEPSGGRASATTSETAHHGWPPGGRGAADAQGQPSDGVADLRRGDRDRRPPVDGADRGHQPRRRLHVRGSGARPRQ